MRNEPSIRDSRNAPKGLFVGFKSGSWKTHMGNEGPHLRFTDGENALHFTQSHGAVDLTRTGD